MQAPLLRAGSRCSLPEGIGSGCPQYVLRRQLLLSDVQTAARDLWQKGRALGVQWWERTASPDYLNSFASRRDLRKAVFGLAFVYNTYFDIVTGIGLRGIGADAASSLASVYFWSRLPQSSLYADLAFSGMQVVSIMSGAGEDSLSFMLPVLVYFLLLNAMVGMHTVSLLLFFLGYILHLTSKSLVTDLADFVEVLCIGCIALLVAALVEYRSASGIWEMTRFIEGATNGILHVDAASGRLRGVSDRLCQELGQWAIEQRSVLDILAPSDRERLLANLKKAAGTAEPMLVTLHCQDAAGQGKTAEAKICFFSPSSSGLVQLCVQVQGEWRPVYADQAARGGALPPCLPSTCVRQESGGDFEDDVDEAVPVPPFERVVVGEHRAASSRGSQASASEAGTTISERAVQDLNRDEVESVEVLTQLASLGQEERWFYNMGDVKLMPKHQLGGGGFGIIVAGCLHGTPVAVKLTKSGGAGWDHRGWPELANEIRILRRVRHPNIVAFYGACIDPNSGVFAILMQLLAGAPLSRFVQEGPEMSEKHAVILQCSGALRHLHALKPRVLHGDLKPSNIMVERRASQPWAVLLDFGLSRLLTRHAQPLGGGTRTWKAPEIARRGSEQQCGSPADVFSFSRVCHFILSGQRPLQQGADAKENEAAALAGEGPTPSCRQQPILGSAPLQWPTLSAEVGKLLNACLSSDPLARPSMEELHNRMAQGMSDTSGAEAMPSQSSFSEGVKALWPAKSVGANIAVCFDSLSPVFQVLMASPDWLSTFGETSCVKDILPPKVRIPFAAWLNEQFQKRYYGVEPDLPKVIPYKRLKLESPRDGAVYKATMLLTFPNAERSAESDDGSGEELLETTVKLTLVRVCLYRAPAPRLDVLPAVAEEIPSKEATPEAAHSELLV